MAKQTLGKDLTMILQICPECKEVIPEGKLRGNNISCEACLFRRNRDDLVNLDTEKAMQAPKQESWNPGLGSSQIGQVQQNGLNGLPQVGAQLVGRLAGEVQDNNPIPIIHSLEELQLIPLSRWMRGRQGWDERYTLEIKSDWSIADFIFPLLWLGFTVPVISFMLYSIITSPESVTVNGRPGESSDIWVMLLFPVLFWGAGGWMLYSAIMSCFAKTWIVVREDSLLIEHGLRRRGNAKTVPRSPNTLVTIESHSSSSKHSVQLYDVYISAGDKIKVADDIDYYRASQMARMLKTLMSAQL